MQFLLFISATLGSSWGVFSPPCAYLTIYPETWIQFPNPSNTQYILAEKPDGEE